jgi:PTS system cellobiose-specific IIB component
MLRIAICCGGGFSSSTMAEHLNKQLRERHLEDEVFLEFIPFANLYGDDSAFVTNVKRDRQSEVDVALLCPHLEFSALDDGHAHGVAQAMGRPSGRQVPVGASLA